MASKKLNPIVNQKSVLNKIVLIFYDLHQTHQTNFAFNKFSQRKFAALV